jgi:putative hydrolase of the HAD superfamily
MLILMVSCAYTAYRLDHFSYNGEQRLQEPALSLPHQPKAVLFDLDDTLFDRSKVFHAWATLFVQRHLLLKEDTPLQELLNVFITLDAYGYTSRANFFAQLQQLYPSLPASVEALIEQYYQQQLTLLELTEGTGTLLQTLQATNIPCGIVTNGRARQMQKVRGLGLDQHTSCVFVSEAFGVKKPDPTIFLAAASHLQIPAAEILFVGDHPYNDIWGAHSVGMRTAWLKRTQDWPDTLSSTIADLTITSLAELHPLFSTQA